MIPDRQDTRSGVGEQIRPAMRPYLAATRNFAAGGATPRGFLEQSLELMEAWEPRIGAFVCTNLPAARAAADRATERWRAGRPLSSIDGMPASAVTRKAPKNTIAAVSPLPMT